MTNAADKKQGGLTLIIASVIFFAIISLLWALLNYFPSFTGSIVPRQSALNALGSAIVVFAFVSLALQSSLGVLLDHNYLFSILIDVLLTGELLAGGSVGIHRLTKVYEEVTNVNKQVGICSSSITPPHAVSQISLLCVSLRRFLGDRFLPQNKLWMQRNHKSKANMLSIGFSMKDRIPNVY